MSLDGTYKVTVQTPMGAQQGKLTVTTSGDTFSGCLETASGTSDFSGGSISGNTLQWRAETKTPLGAFDVGYKAVIEGDNLTGKAETPFGSAPMKGTRI